VVVGFELVGLVGKTVGVIQAHQLFPQRFEFYRLVAAQFFATGGGSCDLVIVGIRLGFVDGKIEFLPKIAGKLFFNKLLSC